MDKRELKAMENRMLQCIKTQFNTRRYERVKCPRLKQMAEFINAKFPDLDAEVRGTSSIKGRQGSSGVYYSQRDYDGNKLTVREKKTYKTVYSHDSTETYRENRDVARWIFDRMDKRYW